MKTKSFTTQLLVLTICCASVLYAVSLLPSLHYTLPFAFSSLLFFVLLTTLIFVIGRRAGASNNKNLLTQLIMALVFIKLLCCLILVIAYKTYFEPPNNHFIIPFILTYIIFTIFEVVVLTKVNRQFS